jgi:hypothetical protein
MKVLEVYTHPNHKDSLEEAIFIRQGFSFKAGIFGFLWCLYHRLWIASGALLSVAITLSLFQENQLLSESFIEGFMVALFLFTGYEGEQWRGAALKKRGYVLKDVMVAPSFDEAQKQFYTNALSHTTRAHAHG